LIANASEGSGRARKVSAPTGNDESGQERDRDIGYLEPGHERIDEQAAQDEAERTRNPGADEARAAVRKQQQCAKDSPDRIQIDW